MRCYGDSLQFAYWLIGKGRNMSEDDIGCMYDLNGNILKIKTDPI